MEVINLGLKNSIFNYFISELRCSKTQSDPMRFRKNLERIGEIFAYEISKSLTYQPEDITTPLDHIEVPLHKDNIVVGSILRAGIPLHTGLLNYFDRAENAFISSYRKYLDNGDFKINFEYLSSPSIEDKVLILADPMLATGYSMEVSYNAMLKQGTPKHTHIVSVIASRQGVEYIIEKFNAKNTTLWVGAVDEKLTGKSYISPGLGDAGDLAFGEKLG
ncbi:uracil phosphoribosyltransferase [Balneicella halophila]|uniref:Uracil phosphoribosyltransferase n=1 Tax=Balneicella halophila TaxID=1537566 RepID=A0A7L4URU0_BALHA|nr:uracil phosphoribosyltransferase [Balneicella halophila]PVX51039.1 uracil phosphoribosyltransferase [Balneicella halophila]